MAKEGKMTGLVRRGTVYWMRVRIPADLISLFGGSKEKVFSLRTSDRTEALERHAIELAKLRAEFSVARSGKQQAPCSTLRSISRTAIDPEETKALVLSWFHSTEVSTSKADREMLNDCDQSTLATFRVDLQEDETTIRQEIGPRHADTFDSDWARRETNQLLGKHGINLDPASDEYAKIHHLVARGLIESKRRRQARLSGQNTGIFTDEFFAATSADDPAPTPFTQSRNRVTVLDLAERFISDRKPTGLRAKTLDTYRLVASRFAEVVGNELSISRLGRDHFVRFRDVLLLVPSNASKKYPGLNLQRVAILAKEQGLPPMSPRTVNKTLETLSALFRYAEDHELVAKNHAQRLSVSEKGAKKRQPFTASQLTTIFRAPLFTGCKNDGHGYATPGTEKPKQARFWIPLIGLFSGMRLNEICQLYVEDVKTESGIHYFHVRTALNDGTEAPDKRLKTPNATRRVPIHGDLKKLGFLKFVEDAKRRSDTRLFPELSLCSSGTYSNIFQKWFSRFLRETAPVELKGVSFHSFRHTFRDALRDANASLETTNRLCGWEESAGMAAHYGHGPTLENLALSMNAVKYAGLDLEHLLPPSIASA